MAEEPRFDVVESTTDRDVVQAVVKDCEGIPRGRVYLHRDRTVGCRIVVMDTGSFLDAAEARVLADALRWAAEQSDAVVAPSPKSRTGGPR